MFFLRPCLLTVRTNILLGYFLILQIAGLSLGFPNLQHQHRLQTCEKCKFTGTTLALPNQKLLWALSFEHELESSGVSRSKLMSLPTKGTKSTLDPLFPPSHVY